ncbi:hypothetical protein [Candidatus Megaera venefica]|nr:hypothetical protein [Candidatus Megaera venefica]
MKPLVNSGGESFDGGTFYGFIMNVTHKWVVSNSFAERCFR